MFYLNADGLLCSGVCCWISVFRFSVVYLAE